MPVGWKEGAVAFSVVLVPFESLILLSGEVFVRSEVEIGAIIAVGEGFSFSENVLEGRGQADAASHVDALFT